MEGLFEINESEYPLPPPNSRVNTTVISTGQARAKAFLPLMKSLDFMNSSRDLGYSQVAKVAVCDNPDISRILVNTLSTRHGFPKNKPVQETKID